MCQLSYLYLPKLLEAILQENIVVFQELILLKVNFQKFFRRYDFEISAQHPIAFVQEMLVIFVDIVDDRAGF
jgi:hypothetical protein